MLDLVAFRRSNTHVNLSYITFSWFSTGFFYKADSTFITQTELACMEITLLTRRTKAHFYPSRNVENLCLRDNTALVTLVPSVCF